MLKVKVTIRDLTADVCAITQHTEANFVKEE